MCGVCDCSTKTVPLHDQPKSPEQTLHRIFPVEAAFAVAHDRRSRGTRRFRLPRHRSDGSSPPTVQRGQISAGQFRSFPFGFRQSMRPGADRTITPPFLLGVLLAESIEAPILKDCSRSLRLVVPGKAVPARDSPNIKDFAISERTVYAGIRPIRTCPQCAL